ncbi:MAG: glycosyltransferase [Bacteroidota bacterium]
MSDLQPDISIVIVNYKVKEYISNLLESVYKARNQLKLEIFVVDNASGDESITYLKNRFPEVIYIENQENLGFGKANNQAIQEATGTYTLIINPDTLVAEDTLSTMFSHMEHTEQCGACGCKIYNPDGTFAPESKRSVPSIISAASKVLGLTTLFPRHKAFGDYYLGWIDEDEQAAVPVLSGCFMFWRTKVLKDIGSFDERFFMYGEDIDLCYRIQSTPYHIDYVPSTSIVHYKGESTRKGDMRYTRIFNDALYLFFEKHYSPQYTWLFKVLIYLVITAKTGFSYLRNWFVTSKALFLDILVLNTSIALGYIIRYALKGSFILDASFAKYLWIMGIATAFFLISGSMFGILKDNRYSVSIRLKTLVVTFTGVIVLTFFIRDLAYSRLGILIAFMISSITLMIIRTLFNRNDTLDNGFIGSSKKAIIVGEPYNTAELLSKLSSNPEWNIDVVGTVTVSDQSKHRPEILGSLPQLEDLVKAYGVTQVFFYLKDVSYKNMLEVISSFKTDGIKFKLIPESGEFILGKSHVEYVESIPLVSFQLEFTRANQQFLKRLFDISLSTLLLPFLFPFYVVGRVFHKPDKHISGQYDLNILRPVKKHVMANVFSMVRSIAIGKRTFVGLPVGSAIQGGVQKEGLTGIIQISRARIHSDADEERFNLHYLQNYSIWLDIDILLKSTKGQFTLSAELDRLIPSTAVDPHPEPS